MNNKTTICVAIATCLILVVGSANAQKHPTQAFGEPLAADAVSVRLSEIMEQPDDFVGKRLRIEGLVDDVCPMKGCWISILEQQSSETIRFKVEDDVIVFPAEAKGHEVVAEGILRARKLDEAAARSWFQHLADEKGEEFDAASVTGPMTIYELEGIGARLGS